MKVSNVEIKVELFHKDFAGEKKCDVEVGKHFFYIPDKEQIDQTVREDLKLALERILRDINTLIEKNNAVCKKCGGTGIARSHICSVRLENGIDAIYEYEYKEDDYFGGNWYEMGRDRAVFHCAGCGKKLAGMDCSCQEEI